MNHLPANNALHKTNCAVSQLVIIDMQTKLADAMQPDVMQMVINNAGILAQAATLLHIPIIVTAQYPQGLGDTLPAIKQHLPNREPVIKTAFSACGEAKFNQQLQRENSHIILLGMEAHICLLQTALDLLQIGKTVFVVEDAIISRAPANKANAIERMRAAGCIITNTESILFEWLGNANHAAFKILSKLIR